MTWTMSLPPRCLAKKLIQMPKFLLTKEIVLTMDTPHRRTGPPMAPQSRGPCVGSSDSRRPRRRGATPPVTRIWSSQGPTSLLRPSSPSLLKLDSVPTTVRIWTSHPPRKW